MNGPPHIGHAYAVIAADVLARFHRHPTSLSELRGTGRDTDVFFLTGTDEHGAKIAEAAAAAGKDPQDFTDEISATFKGAWKALDIQNDDFIRTTEPRHEAGVKKALQELYEKKLLYQKSYRGLYCTGCEKFLTERDLDAEGKCPLHNRVPVEIEEQNWFFKLTEFLPRVKKAVESHQLKIVPEERRNEVLGLLNQDLEDFSISRVRERVPWGIPLPFDDSQTVYVWIDALLNYLTALGYGSDDESKLEKFWPVDVHLIGQDILKFHAVYWPALLLALGKKIPPSIVVHGFFTVSGQKVSKSLGNAIDPLKLVQRYGSDATRFLLLSQFPFGASGDVQVERFDEQYDAVLANTIGNLVTRTVTLLHKFSEGCIPNAPLEGVVNREIREHQPEAPPPAAGYADLVDQLINKPVRLAVFLNQYADITAPWKESNVDKRNIALRSLATGVAAIGLFVEPLLPKTGAAIQHAFGVSGHELPKPGTPIQSTEPAILFPRRHAR